MKKELECLVYKTNEIMEGWGVQKHKPIKGFTRFIKANCLFV